MQTTLCDPILLAIVVGVTGATLLLTWLTFRAKRWASRILALYIISNAIYFTWVNGFKPPGFDIYRAYNILVHTYFFIGAIRLWRIKELPTRFTDPPVEPPVHS
jgi:hypothetical protein